MAGVAKSTVSYVVNRDPDRYIAEKTRRKILQAVEKTNFRPNAAARSLSTRRTRHIGLVVSEAMAGGWGNYYVSEILSGIEDICRERRYGLSISRHKLISVADFVFPAKVEQRSVDGVILVGPVDIEIAKHFRDFDIPCIYAGGGSEVEHIVPAVTIDHVAVFANALDYLRELGHTKIGCQFGPGKHNRQTRDAIIERMSAQGVTIVPLLTECYANYAAGAKLLDWWISQSAEDKPSAVIASDQAIIAFIRDLKLRGLDYPRDVSLICTIDSALARYAVPALTAVVQNAQSAGAQAAKAIIDLLEQKIPLTSVTCEAPENNLIIRDSCKKLMR